MWLHPWPLPSLCSIHRLLLESKLFIGLGFPYEGSLYASPSLCAVAIPPPLRSRPPGGNGLWLCFHSTQTHPSPQQRQHSEWLAQFLACCPRSCKDYSLWTISPLHLPQVEGHLSLLPQPFLAGKPTSRRYTSQMPYLELFVGEPYVSRSLSGRWPEGVIL